MTYVVAEAQKIIAFFCGNTARPRQISCDFCSCGETAEKACGQAEAAVSGTAEDFMKNGVKKSCQIGYAIQSNQQGRQDEKRQQNRNQGIEPEQESGSRGF